MGLVYIIMYIFEGAVGVGAKTYGDYTVSGDKLGSGAFGDIYPAVNKKGETVALKIEKSTCKNPQLFYEYKTLQFLDSDGKIEENGLLKCYDYFTEGEENVMVVRILGESLESIFKKFKKRFPPKTVIQIGLQILDKIEYVHSKGLIHRDIKPENFLIGKDLGAKNIYMIDFGLAKKFRNKSGVHIPYKDNKNLTGTARYASVNTHLGIEQGRRDDIEGMLYMLIYFYRGNLPWQNIEAKNKKEKYEKIMEIKLSTPVQELCEGLPVQILNTLKYTRRLYFDDEPDYRYIRSQFVAALSDSNQPRDQTFCWNLNQS